MSTTKLELSCTCSVVNNFSTELSSKQNKSRALDMLILKQLRFSTALSCHPLHQPPLVPRPCTPKLPFRKHKEQSAPSFVVSLAANPVLGVSPLSIPSSSRKYFPGQRQFPLGGILAPAVKIIILPNLLHESNPR